MPPHAVLSSCVGYLLTALTAAKPSLPFCTVRLIQALCWAQQLQQRRQVAEPIPSTQHWLFVPQGCSVLAAHLGKSRLLGALAERSQFPGDVFVQLPPAFGGADWHDCLGASACKHSSVFSS